MTTGNLVVERDRYRPATPEGEGQWAGLAAQGAWGDPLPADAFRAVYA